MLEPSHSEVNGAARWQAIACRESALPRPDIVAAPVEPEGA
jgi:hypothetical protein